MPSATELLNLYSKKGHIDDFIEETIKHVELNARHGCKTTKIDIPEGLTRTDVEGTLKETFPGCTIKWKWFIQSYEITWG